MTEYRYKIIAVTFFLICNYSFCQRVNFSQIYGGLMEFKSYSVVQAPDGGYVMAGGMSMISGADFIIVKTDSLGNIQWTKSGNRFDGVNFDNKMYSITYLNNYYYLTGEIIINMAASDVKAYFAKCDTAGNIIWDRIDSSYSSWGTRIVKSKDNNLLFTGITANAITGTLNNSWFGKIDTAGNLMWSAVIPDSSLAYATDIEESNDRFIVSAISFVDTGSAYVWGSHVFCMDSLGNSSWNFSETDTSNNGITELVLDSGFIYASQYFSTNFYNPTAYNSSILKFDTSGSIIWRKNLDYLQYGGRGENVGLIKTTDNYLVTVCSGLIEVKFDKDGTDLWKCDQYSSTDQVQQTILNSNGHYISTGYFTISGMVDISFLTDVSDSSITSSNYFHFENPLKIYPNPVVSDLFILSNFHSRCNVKVFNVIGENLSQFEIGYGLNYFDFTKFQNGTYILEFNYGNFNDHYKLLKVKN